MDFADILDEIARPAASADDDTYRRAGSRASPEFWQVLDQLSEGSAGDAGVMKAAYFADSTLTPEVLVDEWSYGELSLEPQDIAQELGLATVGSVEALSSVRRRFALANHPDRVRPAYRDRANQRMTIANMLIDQAGSRLAR
ncbi:hypothetical protein [Aureimonas glaciei]|jgi:hypothetical protein|uniref:Uncharacterized protein n=1 Tax=Aureimonas glaciei TaxID=1776957 RepID=A0A916V0Z4_9HYPH|nr:hypothetical protein [Aureimonas glaciei]GGD02107.1 hypothetical protein GCM10011335_00890 [Aureimonas glaciei]